MPGSARVKGHGVTVSLFRKRIWGRAFSGWVSSWCWSRGFHVCLSREAGPTSRAITELTFQVHSRKFLRGKKVNTEKKKSALSFFFFFLSHLSPLPVPFKPTKSLLPFGAASSYLNLEKLGEGSYATVYKGISRWVTHSWRDFRDEDPSPWFDIGKPGDP